MTGKIALRRTGGYDPALGRAVRDPTLEPGSSAAPMPDELLSAPQVAAILQISEEAVTRAIRQGRLNAARVGRQWIIRRADLDAWKRRVPASD